MCHTCYIIMASSFGFIYPYPCPSREVRWKVCPLPPSRPARKRCQKCHRLLWPQAIEILPLQSWCNLMVVIPRNLSTCPFWEEFMWLGGDGILQIELRHLWGNGSFTLLQLRVNWSTWAILKRSPSRMDCRKDMLPQSSDLFQFPCVATIEWPPDARVTAYNRGNWWKTLPLMKSLGPPMKLPLICHSSPTLPFIRIAFAFLHFTNILIY